MPRREPKEQREECEACSSYPESRQRKAKPKRKAIANIIAKSYQLMVEIKPDAVLVLGDTNSCLSVIGAKLHNWINA